MREFDVDSIQIKFAQTRDAPRASLHTLIGISCVISIESLRLVAVVTPIHAEQ